MTTPGSDVGRELYSHKADTGLWLEYPGEEVNLAFDPTNADIVQYLHKQVLEYNRLRGQRYSLFIYDL